MTKTLRPPMFSRDLQREVERFRRRRDLGMRQVLTPFRDLGFSDQQAIEVLKMGSRTMMGGPAMAEILALRVAQSLAGEVPEPPRPVPPVQGHARNAREAG